MSAETDQFNADIEAIERPEEAMIFRGVSYPGRVTPMTIGNRPEIGGWVRQYTGSFFVRVSALADLSKLPIVGDTVTIAGKEFSIEAKNIPPDQVDIEYTLSSPDR